MPAEHRPYFAQLAKQDRDSLPSDETAVQAMLDSPGWRVVSELVDAAHGDAVRRLLFSHTGTSGGVFDQAEYARLLGFLAGLAQARVAAESVRLYAERVRTREE